MATPHPDGWAQWRADNPGATAASGAERFGVHVNRARAWLRSPAPAPTAASSLPPEDRARVVRTVRGIYEVLDRKVARMLEETRVRDGRYALDRDDVNAMGALAKTAKDLTDAHPDLLELAGVAGVGALGGSDAVERLRAIVRDGQRERKA